jgi:hypothetical protein
MKRLLLVLMLLCVFIPVNAKGTAFVYKMKEADTGMASNDGGSSWEKYKGNHTGYIIVEPGDNNTASIWPINTWTDKGTKQKYYEQQDMMTFGFLQGLIGKNTVWIITYADDVNGGQSFMFSGTAKPVKIGTFIPKPSIAATLTGTMIWLDEEDTYIDVGSGKMSMSLDTLLTTYAYTHTGDETVAHVVDYLILLHYQAGTD